MLHFNFNTLLFFIFGLYLLSFIIDYLCTIHFFSIWIPSFSCIVFYLMLLLLSIPTLILLLCSNLWNWNCFYKHDIHVHFCLLCLLSYAMLYTSITWANISSNWTACLTRYQGVKSAQHLMTPLITQYAMNAISSFPMMHVCTCKWAHKL